MKLTMANPKYGNMQQMCNFCCNNLKTFEDAAERRQRARCRETTVPFAVNRFAMNPVNILVIATFWRMMFGFMAVNVGLRIPGIQAQLKSLAQLPDQL